MKIESAPKSSDGAARRIVVANVILDGRVGGPQRRIVEVAVGLKTLGIDTLLVSPDMGPELGRLAAKKRIVWESIPLSRMRRQRKLTSLFVYFVRFFPEAYRLAALYRRHHVDLVHVNGVFAFQVLLSARLARLPAVWHFNDMALPRPLCLLLRQTLGPLASAFAYSSKRVQEHYGGATRRSSAFLYPPVNMEEFDPSLSCNTVPDDLVALRRRNNELVILAVGNINPFKGYEHLIAAVETLVHLREPWRLVVIGKRMSPDEPYSRMLSDMVSSKGLGRRVDFIGPSVHIADALGAADIVVVCSVRESGPMVLIEALAMRKPVVSTDVGFACEMIRDGENGILVPPGNSRALANAIERLLTDKKLRARLAAVSRGQIPEMVQIASVVQATRQLYLRILSSGSGNSID